MGYLQPKFKRRVLTIDLAFGDTPSFVFKLSTYEQKFFVNGCAAKYEFRNAYNQVIAEWPALVVGTQVELVDINADDSLTIPRGTTFMLTVDDADTNPYVLAWGTVIRSEPHYPGNPDATTEYDAIKYEYDFGTLGRIVDPSWRIMNGAPRVWANSGSLPPGAACGTLFDDASMLWYAPFRGDSVEINYSIVNAGAGKSTVAFCSNYNMTNYLAVTHETGIANNKLHIHTGTGPVNLDVRKSVNHTSSNLANYTIRYNELTDTVSVYKGTDLTPVLEWTDDFKVVDHGEGERYYGLEWHSSLASPGVEFTGIRAQDVA